ncbi:hypothetical protein OG292_27275 [Streptomyces sp. NBC_01511]|uniref:hypothetical protein n=1 Tax=Streptomyces sp. NBC_01511 TaxID=2903889 RepID=UPI0038704144
MDGESEGGGAGGAGWWQFRCGVLRKEAGVAALPVLLLTEVAGEQGMGRRRIVHGRCLPGGAETAGGGGTQLVQFAEDPAQVERRVAAGDLLVGEQDAVVTGRGGDQPACRAPRPPRG